MLHAWLMPMNWRFLSLSSEICVLFRCLNLARKKEREMLDTLSRAFLILEIHIISWWHWLENMVSVACILCCVSSYKCQFLNIVFNANVTIESVYVGVQNKDHDFFFSKNKMDLVDIYPLGYQPRYSIKEGSSALFSDSLDCDCSWANFYYTHDR